MTCSLSPAAPTPAGVSGASKGASKGSKALWIAQDELRRTRLETLRLTDLSQAMLDATPPDGGWSVGEVLDHLIKGEGIYRTDFAGLIELAHQGREPVIRHDLSEFDISLQWVPRSLTPLLLVPFGLFSRVAPQRLKRVFAGTRLLPIRNAAESDPVAGRPREDLHRDLRRSLAETDAVLGGASGYDPQRMRVYLPLVGRRTLPELVTFAADHERRHQGQIREILASSRRAA